MLTMRMPSRMGMRLWIRMRPGPWPRLRRRSRSMAMMAMSLSIWFFVYWFISFLSFSASFSPSLFSSFFLFFFFSPSLPFPRIPRYSRGIIRPISARRDENRILDGFDVTHGWLLSLLRLVQPFNSLSLVQFEHFARDLLDGFEARIEQFPPIQRGEGDLEGSRDAQRHTEIHRREVDRGAGDGVGWVGDTER